MIRLVKKIISLIRFLSKIAAIKLNEIVRLHMIKPGMSQK